jgi:hypothetical protein
MACSIAPSMPESPNKIRLPLDDAVLSQAFVVPLKGQPSVKLATPPPPSLQRILEPGECRALLFSFARTSECARSPS